MGKPSKPVKRCPECGSTRLIRDYGNSEVVCIDCGFVIAAKIADRRPEWRAFNGEQWKRRTRVGAPLTYTIHDKGLSTVIDWRDMDVHGKRINPDQRAKIYRLRTLQRRSRVSDSKERNLYLALCEIMMLTNKLSLPKAVSESASIIYRKALNGGIVRGRSIQGLSTAAVYLACREFGVTRTLDDVASAANLSRKELGRNYRFIVKALDLHITPPEPSIYISKISNKLVAQGNVEEAANKILKAAKRLKMTSGKGPRGLAAAACYIASVITGERVTQKEISDAAGVTEVTVRNRYKEFSKRLLIIMTL